MTRLIVALSVIVGVIAVVAVAVAVTASVRVTRDDTKIRELTTLQKEGRRLALGVNCAALSAIAEAGRETIMAATPLPPGVEQLLEAHGFPTPAERRAAAKIAADNYVHRISATVESQVGRRGDGLVNANGTLNCARLQVVARAR